MNLDPLTALRGAWQGYVAKRPDIGRLFDRAIKTNGVRLVQYVANEQSSDVIFLSYLLLLRRKILINVPYSNEDFASDLVRILSLTSYLYLFSPTLWWSIRVTVYAKISCLNLYFFDQPIIKDINIFHNA